MYKFILYFIVAPLLAVVLDLLIGDPVWLYHPIRAVGKVIETLEKLIRKVLPKNNWGELIGGIVIAVIVPSFFICLILTVLLLVYDINFYLFLLLEVIFSYQLLAAKSLKTESDKVRICLGKKDIIGARKALSYIVGRDTDNMSEADIVIATIETIAENTSDGVIAPFFYLSIGGSALCFGYKAVNTLDSMIGYRNKKYEYFGKLSAILDDIVNYIPARISAFIMILASKFCRFDYEHAIKIYRRDRKNHTSPNSAYTESVCAGALNLKLGGGASYGGIWASKPTIGDRLETPKSEHILLANKLMLATTILSAMIFTLLKLVIILIAWGR